MSKATWKPNLGHGAGYDRVRGDARAEGVLGEAIPVPGAGGQEGDSNLVIIQSADEYDEMLGIHAEAEGTAGLFGGSAKFDFKKRSKVSSQATFCLLRVFAVNAYVQFMNPKLNDEAVGLLRNGKKERFRQRFGDLFVSGMYTGCEFYGSVRIEAQKFEEQQSIAADISASYALVNRGEASIDINNKHQGAKFLLEIFTYQKGGEVNVCRSLDDLFTLAQDALNRSRNGEAYPFAVELTDYRQLALPGDDVSLIDIEFARRVCQRLAGHMQALDKMSNDIDFVLRNQDWFDAVKVDELNAANVAISAELNVIKEKADDAATKPEAAQDYAPRYPQFVMPSRKAGAPQIPPPSPPASLQDRPRYITLADLLREPRRIADVVHR